MSERPDLGLGLRYEEEPGPPRRRRRGLTGVAVLVALLVLAGGIGVGAVGVHRIARYLLSAPDWTGTGYGTVVVQVPSGATATDIGHTLVNAGVVRSVAAFTDAADANSRSGLIGPGYYRLRKHMSAAAALNLMLLPSSLVFSRVTVPEGFTVGQVVARLARQTRIPLAQLQQVVAAPGQLSLPPECGGQLEGCLFPATYNFAPGTTARQALGQMVVRFEQAVSDLNLDQAAHRVGLSAYQVLIVASILEREARFGPDFPRVARVIYNRLARNMRLELDSTVLYALHVNKLLVTMQDTRVPSPYNTYLHPGLPPGPIDSPGTQALLAALRPASGDWLYFVAVDLAGHDKFTNSYTQFLAFKAEADRNRGT